MKVGNISWAQLFICFYIFSVVGHYLELIWAPIAAKISGKAKFRPLLFTVAPLAMPYGLGAVVLIIALGALMNKISAGEAFILSAILMGGVEYLSAVIIKITHGGQNPYWDYSDRRFNIQGQVCLANALLFGVTGIFFLKWILPSLTNFFFWLGENKTIVLGEILCLLFVIDMIYSSWKHFGVGKKWLELKTLPKVVNWRELLEAKKWPDINQRLAWLKARREHVKENAVNKLTAKWECTMNRAEESITDKLKQIEEKFHWPIQKAIVVVMRIVLTILTLGTILIWVLPSILS